MRAVVYDKRIKSVSQTANNGLGRLTTAYGICINQKINGEHTLEFTLPLNSEEWELIENENLVKVDGQLY